MFRLRWLIALTLPLLCLLAACGSVVNLPETSPAATQAASAPTAAAPAALVPTTTPPAPASATPTVPAPTATSLPPTPTPRVITFEDFKKVVDPVVLAFMKDNNVAACSLAVAHPDSAGKLETLIINYGTLSKSSKTPADTATEYEIGSLTKLFTADLLALYVRDRLMKLDDPLQQYLPSTVRVPTFNGQPITLRELATHTSSLPRKPDNLPEFRAVNGVVVWGYASAGDMEKALAEVSLTHAPGTQWEYSNFAFGLLAMAEEKVGNAPYETLVVNNIAEPLGMHDTRISLATAQKARLAQAIGANGDPVPPVATSGESLGAGAFRSTIQDLALYLAENIDPGTTKLASVLELTQQRHARGANANNVAGLGWNISSPGTPRESTSKDGATVGYDAYIAFSRPSRTGFAVACDGHGLAKSLVPPLGKLIGEFDVPIDDAE